MQEVLVLISNWGVSMVTHIHCIRYTRRSYHGRTHTAHTPARTPTYTPAHMILLRLFWEEPRRQKVYQYDAKKEDIHKTQHVICYVFCHKPTTDILKINAYYSTRVNSTSVDHILYKLFYETLIPPRAQHSLVSPCPLLSRLT